MKRTLEERRYTIEVIYKKPTKVMGIRNQIDSYHPLDNVTPPCGSNSLNEGIRATFNRRRPVIKLMKILDDVGEVTITNH